MTRQEHLKWAKDRAIEYANRGDITGAWGSLVSDLNKHKETRGHDAILLGSQLVISGHLNTAEKMREFIDGVQ